MHQHKRVPLPVEYSFTHEYFIMYHACKSYLQCTMPMIISLRMKAAVKVFESIVRQDRLILKPLSVVCCVQSELERNNIYITMCGIAVMHCS